MLADLRRWPLDGWWCLAHLYRRAHYRHLPELRVLHLLKVAVLPELGMSCNAGVIEDRRVGHIAATEDVAPPLLVVQKEDAFEFGDQVVLVARAREGCNPIFPSPR